MCADGDEGPGRLGAASGSSEDSAPARAGDFDTLDRLERQLRRLAFDLHDGPMQSVAAARIQAGVCASLAMTTSAEEACLELREQLDVALAELHELAYGLRPPALDVEALGEMLRRHVNGLGDGDDPDVRMTVAPDLPPLSGSARIAIFRIVQEALNNALRHAGARRVDIAVRAADGSIECEIVDDGHGFDPSTSGAGRSRRMGLLGMHERAELLGGDLLVDSSAGGGTRVMVRIPVWS